MDGGDDSRALYNVNYRTAIGLGDEPATVVGRFGQLKSDDANIPELANAARPECMHRDSRLGTGDTPHGWAAPSYILLHGNSMVYENGNDLELCWGVAPKWLAGEAHIWVKDAPTKFGTIDFNLRRSASVLTLEHSMSPNPNRPKPSKVRLHIPPPLRNEIATVRVNGRAYTLSPEESVLRID